MAPLHGTLPLHPHSQDQKTVWQYVLINTTRPMIWVKSGPESGRPLILLLAAPKVSHATYTIRTTHVHHRYHTRTPHIPDTCTTHTTNVHHTYRTRAPHIYTTHVHHTYHTYTPYHTYHTRTPHIPHTKTTHVHHTYHTRALTTTHTLCYAESGRP